MKRRIQTLAILAFAGLAVCLGGGSAVAQDNVRMRISSQETWVGVPVDLLIEVQDIAAVDAPVFPDVDGVDITSSGSPGQSLRVSIINGRRSESRSVTWQYRITPRRAGTFEIPSITVPTANGTVRTQAFRISATQSETGDLLFAEVVGQKDKLFVGQPIDLTLRIWLKPYRDPQRGVTLSQSDMFQTLVQNTQWGPFSESLQQAAGDGQQIRAREVLRADGAGIQRSYYLYEVDATFYPKRAGALDVGDVQVVSSYPTQLGQSRDPFASLFDDSIFGGSPFDDDFFASRGFSPFGRGLNITDTRPIAATPEIAPIEIVAIPATGRPADYRGAVGQYQMVTQASPTSVKAGDPITLTIGIRGTGPMELVQAPPLAEIPALNADFRVSNEPLAGIVQEDIKVFTTTIRPRRAGITEIPAIPFSFFDPDSGQFVTVNSDPLTVEVAEAETLALDSVVGGRSQPNRGAAAEYSATAGPILDLFQGDNLLTNQSMRPDPRFWLPLFAIPLLAFGLVRVVRRRNPGHLAGGGRRSTIKRIEQADHARHISAALLEMLAGKLDLPAASLTRAQAVRAVTDSAAPELAEPLDRILADCEQAAFAGDTRIPLDQFKSSACQLVGPLASVRRVDRRPGLRLPNVRESRRLLMTGALAACVLVATGWSLFHVLNSPTADQLFASQAEAGIQLDPSQQMALLDEAFEAWQRGRAAQASDMAESSAALSAAAQKYQTLVDSGIQNNRLYFNLGTACLQTGATGRAIANYRLRVEAESAGLAIAA